MSRELGIRAFWLHVVRSENKKVIQPRGFVLRRPAYGSEQFYTAHGTWCDDITAALTFEHLAGAEVLRKALRAARDAHPEPAQALNPVMAELGLMPSLQVVFWGIADGKASYVTALW